MRDGRVNLKYSTNERRIFYINTMIVRWLDLFFFTNVKDWITLWMLKIIDSSSFHKLSICSNNEWKHSTLANARRTVARFLPLPQYVEGEDYPRNCPEKFSQSRSILRCVGIRGYIYKWEKQKHEEEIRVALSKRQMQLNGP